MYQKADPSQQNRTEDQIIAWLWRVFIETNGSDPVLLARLPMTKVRQMSYGLWCVCDIKILIFILKAAVRAMDATQQFLRQQEIQVPGKFIVAGVSKVSRLTAGNRLINSC